MSRQKEAQKWVSFCFSYGGNFFFKTSLIKDEKSSLRKIMNKKAGFVINIFLLWISEDK